MNFSGHRQNTDSLPEWDINDPYLRTVQSEFSPRRPLTPVCPFAPLGWFLRSALKVMLSSQGRKAGMRRTESAILLGDYLFTPDSLLLNSLLPPPQADLRCTQLELEQKLKLNENAIARLQANHKSVLVRLTRVTSLASACLAATAGDPFGAIGHGLKIQQRSQQVKVVGTVGHIMRCLHLVRISYKIDLSRMKRWIRG